MTMVCAKDNPFETGELSPRERAHLWVDSRFDDLECLHARFQDYQYSPHFHDTFVFGRVEQGVEHCRSRGLDFALTPGTSLTIINPGDLHDGRPGEEGYEYRMFYPSVELMRQANEECGGSGDIPWFSNCYVEDRLLSERIGRLHRLLESEGCPLEAESLMLETLTHLVLHHGDQKPVPGRIGDESSPVAKVCDFVRDGLDQEFGLEDMATIAGLNRYQLIRAFRKEMGMTPHAYVINRRVEAARGLLKNGVTLSAAALDCGFYDQAHFSRIFKRVVGVTPGAYRNACHG
ncbi:AraC family transcriptional regulator [Aestuariispira insulae]|uniref:AraC-like DNA-binding protein n=1 Tax=Aestuariispira insulae TaxID=1461337 RepID=A0A3D9HJQ5_9PROT|nr:AraC family transcriptional regulator [Aestuariispira insulae]RED49684.1 AraC-like DNA-binding protein [Aestuariispira insulae]